MKFISKKEAIKNNQKWYFTGLPCKNGHIDKRYINTDICYECKRKNVKNDYLRHKERIKISNNKSYRKNIDRVKETSKKWKSKNMDRVRASNKKNKLKYHDKYLEAEKKRMREKRRSDNFFRLCRNISKALWEWMKTGKNYKHWEDILGYTSNDLIKYLELKFRDGMNWNNYGYYWHVDHIKPLSKCLSLEEAWSLNNLQPLLKFENLSKGNKYNE